MTVSTIQGGTLVAMFEPIWMKCWCVADLGSAFDTFILKYSLEPKPPSKEG